MEPVFTFHLGERVEPGRVTLGWYDGEHPVLTVATPGGKIVMHSPHDVKNKVKTINLQKQITGLLAAPLGGHSKKDVLYVGSETDLLCMDVDDNKDIFHKELPDGVYAMTAGKFGESKSDLVFAGGNCSIQGFDASGNDHFWTVTGDNVSSMALCDLVGDGHNQLLAATEDSNLRVYLEGNELLHEFPDTEQVKGMCDLRGSRFAYGLGNGSIGTYEGPQKSWRVQMKARPNCVAGFDMTMDGTLELVTGWSDGTLDVRKDRANGSGEILIRDKFPCAVAGLVQGDYRNNGTNMILAVSVEGEVRGYNPLNAKKAKRSSLTERQPAVRRKSDRRKNKNSEVTETEKSERRQSDHVNSVAQQEEWNREIERLVQEKRDLQLELKQLGQFEAAKERGGSSRADDGFLLVPNIETELSPSDTGGGLVYLNIKLGIDARIFGVILRSEGLFESGQKIILEPQTSQKISMEVPIVTLKNVAVKLDVRVIIGIHGSPFSAVHDINVHIPEFATMTEDSTALNVQNIGASMVSIPIRYNSVLSQIEQWGVRSFINKPRISEDGKLGLLSRRGNIPVHIDFWAEKGTEIHIYTESFEIASDLVHSIATAAGISELKSNVHFPKDFDSLRNLLEKVDGLNSARQRISADIAEKSELAKGLLFQAEDRRDLQAYDGMQESYQNLFNLNRDLLAQYAMRCTNQNELVQCVKQVRCKC